MTYRQRREARAAKRREWAAKRRAESSTRLEAAHELAQQRPLGQPILVGHHSEAGARAHQRRIESNMDKGCEAAGMATKHAHAADTIERQLDLSIYDDDPDAIERLTERIAAREAQRTRVKELNRIIRREYKAGGGERLGERLRAAGLTDQELRAVVQNARHSYREGPPIFPPYHLTNLGGNIRRDRERIKDIEAKRARTAEAEAAGGVAIQASGEYARVTFAEKPERSVIDALKAAGFHWSGGSWLGRTDRIPAEARPYDTPAGWEPTLGVDD